MMNMYPTLAENYAYDDGYGDGYDKGYEHAIEKAKKWLEENKDHPFIGCEDPCLSGYLTDEFIKEFKKAMKGGDK